ncbi:MAG: type IV secretion system DNA-binding domain-containing protein [bacterium]
MQKLSTLLVTIPRDTEVTPEMAATFLSTFPRMLSISTFDYLIKGKSKPVIAMEIGVWEQKIRFILTCSLELVQFVTAQIHSTYPLAMIVPIEDPLKSLASTLTVGELRLSSASFYPIKTWNDFRDTDPMNSYLSVLSKAEPGEVIWLSFNLAKAKDNWQGAGQQAIDRGKAGEVRPSGGFQGKGYTSSKSSLPEARGIQEKIMQAGFAMTLRIGTNKPGRLSELAAVFGVYGRPDGNAFILKTPITGKKKWQERLLKREASEKKVVNLDEMATLWHLPSEKVKIPMIMWGTAVFSEPPENLPIADGVSEEERAKINYFGRTIFKNRDLIFGIKDADRRRHVWAIGKTGTGKSTFIANMAIDDLKKGRGVAVIDPHGDLSDILLNYIPASRINDVIYFNPVDRERPVRLNVLEVKNPVQRELVVSGIVAIFNKLYGHSWGPRLEYILRNTLLALSEAGNSTLADVPRMLSDQEFRRGVVGSLKDEVIKRYFENEFEKMPDKLKQESISPILNKVGQFISSPLIREVVSSPVSSIDMEEIMNDGKILIANLSQGSMGEDNAALIGAMLITKFQLAAMNRVSLAEEERRDFYLYVDEFQNFATTSFIKILSEARKYRLSLIMANQYMAQIPIEVQKAILGNTGTIASFTIGAEDARIIMKEFGDVFTDKDLVNLENYQIAIRLMVDSMSGRAFLAKTLPLPASANQNRDKVIRVSRERWGR